MNIAAIVASRYRLSITMVLIFSGLGVAAWFTMPRMEDPKLPERWGLIVTPFPGADAETVERLVARPLEDAITEVDAVKEIRSTSRADVAIVFVEMRDRISTVSEVNKAWDDVREKIDEARREFPDGVGESDLNRKLNDTEAIVLAVTGSNDPLVLLQAAKRLRREFLRLPDVSRVELSGDPGEQITVEYDDALSLRLGVTPSDLAGIIASRNVTTPGGTLRLGDKAALLRADADFDTVDELRDSPVLLASGAAVTLGDLTRVRHTTAEPVEAIMRADGKLAVGVGIIPREGINVVTFGEAIRAHTAELRPLVAPLTIEEVSYQPRYTKERLDELSWSLFEGIIVLAIMLFVAMGWRMGFVVSSIVPLVSAAALAAYFIGGGILHQISIAALVIALGQFVDNAIVMADAVQRHLDEGSSGREAAAIAVRELSIPLVSATGTNIAAFIPMLLSEGATGDFTRAIPVLIIITLLISAVFAVIITPTIAATVLRKPDTASLASVSSLGRYMALAAVHHPIAMMGLALLPVAISIAMVPMVRQQFFPLGDRAQVVVNIDMPEGTHIATTDAATRKLERMLRARPEVTRVDAVVGSSGPHFYYNLLRRPSAPHVGEIIVGLNSVESVEPMRAFIREWSASNMVGALVTPRRLEQGPPVDAPIEINLIGEDEVALAKAARDVRRIVRAVPGAVDVTDDLGLGTPTLDFAIDAAAAARAGTAPSGVALALLQHTRGLPAGDFRAGEDPVPILVRAARGDTATAANAAWFLAAQPTRANPTAPITPIAQLTRAEPRWSRSIIRHLNGERLITVSAQLGAGVTFSEVMRGVRPQLDALQLPQGVRIQEGGEAESSGEANTALLSSLPLGIAMLLFFLLAQFNSFRRVGIILFTVPLAAAGVIPGLALSGAPFGFTSLLGLFALIGIVVNNTIVLLEVADTRLREGATISEALTDAVSQRIRPIVLTTATTVVGLLPLAFSSTTLWPPMAWAIISGLIASTALTMLAVPAMYRLLFTARATSPEQAEA